MGRLRTRLPGQGPGHERHRGQAHPHQLRLRQRQRRRQVLHRQCAGRGRRLGGLRPSAGRRRVGRRHRGHRHPASRGQLQSAARAEGQAPRPQGADLPGWLELVHPLLGRGPHRRLPQGVRLLLHRPVHQGQSAGGRGARRRGRGGRSLRRRGHRLGVARLHAATRTRSTAPRTSGTSPLWCTNSAPSSTRTRRALPRRARATGTTTSPSTTSCRRSSPPLRPRSTQASTSVASCGTSTS